MHSEAVKEGVTITINVNGEDLVPIKMPVFKEDHLYTLSMASYASGHAFNKEHTVATYNYSIRLERRKTPEEEGKDDATS